MSSLGPPPAPEPGRNSQPSADSQNHHDLSKEAISTAGPSVLHRFFAGHTEYTFTQLGVVDPEIVGYVTGLLERFVRTSHLNKVRTLSGEPIHNLPTLYFEAGQRVGEARRASLQFVGDLTLFHGGVYPEGLQTIAPPPISHFDIGKRSYGMAAMVLKDACVPIDQPSNALLSHLASSYEMISYGLREVRRSWEDWALNSHDPRLILE